MKDKMIGAKEIKEALGISKAKAYEIIHMFEFRKQAYRVGQLIKIKERTFTDWLEFECKCK